MLASFCISGKSQSLVQKLSGVARDAYYQVGSWTLEAKLLHFLFFLRFFFPPPPRLASTGTASASSAGELAAAAAAALAASPARDCL